MRLAPFRLSRPAMLFSITAAMVGASGSGAGRAPPREINSLAKEMSPRISQCLIRREPELIDRWLRTLPGSAEEERLFRGAEPRFSPCFGMPYGINGAVWLPKYDKAGMRAALVRALLQARRTLLPSVPPAASEPPLYAPRTGDNATAVVAADLGACLARKHWNGLLAIVRAVDPESFLYSGSRKARTARKREAAAVDSELTKMIPSIAACVPAGAKLRIERPRLRTLLEEAAYHMTNDGTAATARRE